MCKFNLERVAKCYFTNVIKDALSCLDNSAKQKCSSCTIQCLASFIIVFNVSMKKVTDTQYLHKLFVNASPTKAFHNHRKTRAPALPRQKQLGGESRFEANDFQVVGVMSERQNCRERISSAACTLVEDDAWSEKPHRLSST
ncbi:hypothetical protein MPSEU_000822800 [Mayamaea pseudoterrestris]|nr:hypothetical protein MPSEU_000822800 [Mayamaea pseudoterrestris]